MEEEAPKKKKKKAAEAEEANGVDEKVRTVANVSNYIVV